MVQWPFNHKTHSIPDVMKKTSLPKILVACALMMAWHMPSLTAQSTYRLTLDEVVELAQSDAPDALLASTRWKRDYWTFRSFQADFRPNILLNASTLPLFNRSIEPITLSTGEEAYVARAYMDNQVNLSLQQDVALTGGTVYFGSGLGRLDVFETKDVQASRSYLSNPINLG